MIFNENIEEQRLKILKSYNVLATEADADFDRIVALASSFFDVPIAVISFLLNDTLWFKAKKGLDINETTKENSFCNDTIDTQSVVIIEDASLDNKYKNMPQVTEMGLRFYAGIPIIDKDGILLGVFAIMDTKPRTFSHEDVCKFQLLVAEITHIFESRKEIYFYKSLFELSKELICTFTLDGTIQKVNDWLLASLGWTENEVIGNNIAQFIHPDDLEATLIDLKRLIDTGILITFENRILSKNGDYKVLTWNTNVNLDSQLLFAIGRDITDIRKSEIEQKNAELKWKFAIEGAGDGLWDWDIVNNSVFFSTQWKKMLGFEEHEIGACFEECSDRLHPEDKEKVLEDITDCLQNKTEVYENEHRVLCKDGTYKWVLDRGIVLDRDNDGNPARMIGTHHDLTRRKKQEEFILLNQERFNEAQKIAKIGNWEFNTSTNEIYWSQQMYEIYEFDKNITQDELQKLYYGSFTEIELKKLQEQVQHAIQTGEPYALERKLILKNGEREKWIFGQSKVTRRNGDVILSGTVQDITDEKILELDFVESQEKLEDAQKISKTGSWEVNLLTNEAYWSPEQYRIFEVEDVYSPSELRNVWRSRFHPDDRDILQENIDKSIQNRTSFDIELRVLLDNNTLKYVKSLGYVVYNDKNEACSFVGTCQDVTNETLLFIENQKIQERLNDAQKISKIGSWEIDLLNGKITWSKQQYEIYELDENLKDEPLRQAWRKIVCAKDLEDLEQLTHFAISTGQEYSLEIKAYFDNGTRVKYILAIGYILKDENGNNTTYVGTAQDITERKLIELENQKNQESLNDAQRVTKIGSWEFDVISRELLWTDELYRIYEIDKSFKNDELIQKNRTLLNEADLANLDMIIAKTLVNGEENSLIFKAHFDDGQRFKYVKSKVFGIKNEEGKVVKLAGTTQDITESKLLEDELIAAKEIAETASFAKSEFLANMSHEIRTPLNGVIGFSDLLMNTKLDTTQKLYINTINNSAKSLLDIINDILDFSKIEAGKLDVEHQQTDIEKVLSEASNIVAYQCQTKKIELLLNISTDLPQLIWADPVRLRQILVNLLSNAVKFTLNGEIELKVDVLSKTINKSKLRFSVRDTGVGIHPDKIKNIFKAFSQEDTSITRKFGGTGLGLTISNKLLSLMNGSPIQVESELGKGSVFYFDINFQSQNKKDNQYDYWAHVKKVLIVENNNKASQIIARILKIRRIDAEFASDGIEALYLLKKQSDFDAIIVDYNLPDLNGMEVISKIRSNANPLIAQTPIILLHSSAEDSNLESLCVKYDVKQQILKPVIASSLLNALSKMNEVDEVKINDIASTSSTIDTKGKIESVLITDDNSVNILLAKTIVKNILPNAIIYEAKNGLEAVEIYKNSKPSIILMDVQMPEMNGYEATKEIRLLESETNTHVPIIALTAGTVLGEKERCLDAGMDNYVSKPFVKETIAKTIQQYLFI